MCGAAARVAGRRRVGLPLVRDAAHPLEIDCDEDLHARLLRVAGAGRAAARDRTQGTPAPGAPSQAAGTQQRTAPATV